MKQTTPILYGATLSILLAGALYAQQKPTPPPTKEIPPAVPTAIKAKPAQKEKKAFLELKDSKYTGKTKTYTGTNFVYTSEDMKATGNTAKYHEDTEILEAEGNIVIDTEKAHITGNKAVVDDSAKKKLAIITENVIIEVKPKKKPEEPAKPDEKAPANPTPQESKEPKKASVSEERNRGITVFCDKVENEYKKKYVKMFGNLTFKQKVKKKDGMEVERTLFAEHAEYDGKADKMRLFAPVHGEDTDGQKVEFEKDVLIGTKEDEETLETMGAMKLEILRHDDEDDTKKDDKTPAKEPNKDGKPAPNSPAAPPKKVKR